VLKCIGKKNIFCHDAFESWGREEMMDEGHSGNTVNIVAGSNGPGTNENVRRGDYFVLGFIGVLLAGVTAYLVLNPEESTLRSGMEVEKGNAHKLVHEPVASHALVHEPAKQEPVLSSPPVSEPVESELEVVKPEVAKPEATKPEVTKPEVTKPEATKPEATKPEATKPEATKPEATKPEPATVTSTPGHENKLRANGLVWAVNLVSYSRLDSARKVIAQLKSEGVDTEFVEVTARGHRYYRVRIPNLSSRQEAIKASSAFRARPEFEGLWIARYRK